VFDPGLKEPVPWDLSALLSAEAEDSERPPLYQYLRDPVGRAAAPRTRERRPEGAEREEPPVRDLQGL